MRSWFEEALIFFKILPVNSCCSNYIEPNSVAVGITAAGNSSQSGSTAITKQYNEVSTVTSSANGVRLPVAADNQVIFIKNDDSADTLKVYPATGGVINALSTNAAQTIAAGKSGYFIGISTTAWKYILVN